MGLSQLVFESPDLLLVVVALLIRPQKLALQLHLRSRYFVPFALAPSWSTSAFPASASAVRRLRCLSPSSQLRWATRGLFAARSFLSANRPSDPRRSSPPPKVEFFVAYKASILHSVDFAAQ